MQPTQNNLVQEIGLIAISVAIVVGAVVLRILGNIDNVLLLEIIGVAGALWGLNGALKAPSPSQQVQLNAQQQNLQQLVSYALGMLPGLVQSLSQQTPPVASPQPRETGQPTQVQSPVPAPVVPPVTQPSAMGNPVTPLLAVQPFSSGTAIQTQPGQFKTISIPDVSMPTIPVVGQGIPLGQ